MISILQQVKHEAFSEGYREGRHDMAEWRDMEAAEVAYWDGYKAAARENQIHLFVLAAVILLLILIF